MYSINHKVNANLASYIVFTASVTCVTHNAARRLPWYMHGTGSYHHTDVCIDSYALKQDCCTCSIVLVLILSTIVML